jgi:hypothetical protein
MVRGKTDREETVFFLAKDMILLVDFLMNMMNRRAQNTWISQITVDCNDPILGAG